MTDSRQCESWSGTRRPVRWIGRRVAQLEAYAKQRAREDAAADAEAEKTGAE